MLTGRRRIATIVAFTIATTALAVGGLPAAASDTQLPSVRLVTPRTKLTIHRFQGGSAWLDAGVLLAATHGAFDVRVSKPDYDQEPFVWQVLGENAIRALPSDIASVGFTGLSRFARVTMTDSNGDVVLREARDFCPAGSDVRVNGSGPQTTSYPRYCWSSPFMLGTVYGIDQGWATPIFGYDAPLFDGPDGWYTMRIAIQPRYRDLFAIPASDAVVTLSVKIKTDDGGGCRDICPQPGVRPGSIRPGSVDHSANVPVRGALGSAPSLTNPPADAVPDLVAGPAWSIQLTHRNHRDRIEFAATVWNRGPSPMVVEGYRQQDATTMDAFQYFFRDGEVVGRARVGELEFDTRHGHQHWHFKQFARYSLLDADMHSVVRSKKESFCLAPTDAIDLTVPGADWQPGSTGLGTACGGPDAVWIREVLQTGWGDTYYQSVAGQSLDVTDLPNGVYYMSVEANPTGLLYEADTSNNQSYRKIILKGTPGHREIVVKPWHGIDI